MKPQTTKIIENYIMNGVKCLFFLFFIAVANGDAIQNRTLLDPLRQQRKVCREQLGLTEEQVEAGYQDLRTVEPFFICMARRVGVLKNDGSINTNALIELLKTQVPLVILRPIAECCDDEAFHGQIPPPNELFSRLVAYSNCWKDRLNPTLFGLTGVLGKPVYPPLDTCQKHW